MLIREAERKKMHYCISGTNELSVQKLPFFRELVLDEKDVVLSWLRKFGSCVPKAGFLRHLEDTLSVDLRLPEIARVRIGRW